MDDLKDLDLYGLLGVLQSATIQEVKKAYRKKALSCHPDKNPDNPKAAELFHQLSRALEILIDESARAAYDKVINAKKAAVLRNQALDSKRKKLKEDLEARERQAQENAVFRKNEKTPEEKLQAEIERLRKEGSKQLEEEIEYIRQEIIKERSRLVIEEEEESSPLYRLKVRWESTKVDETNGGYNKDNLNKIFSKYGDITGLVVSHKKKGSALLEFKTSSSAVKAFQLETGFPSNPLIVEWLSGVAPPAMKQPKDRPTKIDGVGGVATNIPPKTSIFPSMQQNFGGKTKLFPSFPSTPDVFSKVQQTKSDEDYESIVFKNLRQAEERKRILEEEDKEET